MDIILHTSPHHYGQARSTWTLESLAQMCCEQVLIETPMSRETIRHTLLLIGVSWKRAKQWITSPDPDYYS